MEKISGGTEWWRKVAFPARRVWNGVVSRLGIRRRGNLKRDVQACQYEDVQIMWKMLQRNESDLSLAKKSDDRLFWSFFRWAQPAPSLSGKIRINNRV